MTIKDLLGKRIKELRIKNNMKQAQLAEIVGIDPKHQSCIENCKNFPSTDLLEKYAKAFKIDATDLLNIDFCIPKAEILQKIQALINNASENDLQLIYRICLAVLK